MYRQNKSVLRMARCLTPRTLRTRLNSIVPLVLPIVLSFGGDLIWFGIVTVIAVEMGLLTPPLGIAVYVVRSTITDASITLNQIFRGAFPYVVIMLAVTILLIAFPQLSLALLN